MTVVGDKRQLLPVVTSSFGEKGQFQDQLKISLMARLESYGFPYGMLTTQYRMVPEISAIVNDNIYHGILTNDPGTAVENRPMAQ